jgi:long-chain acyl-CoA synthetase
MEKIWLKSYPPGVATEINPDKYASLTSMLQESCHEFSGNIAFENFNTELSYQTLLEKSLMLAAYLQKHLQLGKGDRFAMMLPNLLQYPIIMLAALQLGLIIVNINPLYTARELLIPLKDSGAKAIIMLANHVGNLAPIINETQIKHVLITELGDEFHGLKRLAINSYFKYFKYSRPTFSFPAVIYYREAIQEGKKISFDDVVIEPDDIAFLQYTGGTTGPPKGAMLTHRNLVANVIQCIEWMGGLLEKGREAVVTALPLYHIFSLTVCCFVFWKLGGRSLLVTNPRDINSLIKLFRNKPCTVFMGVNTLYRALIQHPAFNTLNFNSLKISLAGGMPIMKKIADQWQSATHKTIIMGYGLTEASPAVTVNPLYTREFSGSIGLPLPSTEVAILDDEGRELALGETGELAISGPQVMLGYWNQLAETKNVFTKAGWLKTGDIARMDNKGYIYLIDRKKDMILISGFNVYPHEVEEVIASHPGVAEVAVIGVPNTQSEESVKAFIVKKDLALTEEDIKDHCKQKLTGYKRPQIIEFCQKLPKSSVGKVLKNKLREINRE